MEWRKGYGGVPKWKFLPGQSISSREKSGNVTLPPLKNIPLTPLCVDIYYWGNFLTSPTFDCTRGYAPKAR